MRREDLKKLGVPIESIEEIMRLHGKTVSNIKQKRDKQSVNREYEQTRDAVINMLPMIKEPENMRQLLKQVNYLYHVENRISRAEKEEGAETMSYFKKCEACGANLDPGEKCDCMESITMTPSEETEQTQTVVENPDTAEKEEAAQ